MARVTVERALKNIENRFELVLLSSHRAHIIAFGGKTKIDTKNKPAVMALREFELDDVNIDTMRQSLMQRFISDKQAPIASSSFISSDFELDDLFGGNKIVNNNESNEENTKIKKKLKKEASTGSFDENLFSDE